ncbi:hypothetical protein B0H17DRAFT_1083363 [Mycena rosella]|uniref:Uncharacterized protein n=1 Tax=Mycena rosella TaxID=1033263 RepID=A0AAD7D216_MYCRO|nr:hypothetical protein B0H17DRAFT_1083363 [Mycena rosella]
MKSFLPALAITLPFFGAAYAFDVEYCVRESKPRRDTQTLSRPYMYGVHLTDIAEQRGRMLRHQRPGNRIRVQRRAAGVRGPHSAGRHHHRECGLRDIPVRVVQPRERMDRSSAVVELRAPASIIIRLRYSRKLVSTVHAKHKAECSVLVVYFSWCTVYVHQSFNCPGIDCCLETRLNEGHFRARDGWAWQRDGANDRAWPPVEHF